MHRTILVPLAVFVAAGLLFAAWSRGSVVQPISFNHQKHQANGLECSACHTLYRTSGSAGRPATDTCMACHETPLTKSAEEEKIRQYAARGEEIPWRRLQRLPEHVYFSHQTHVVSAQVECKSCHGGIGQSASPPLRAEIKFEMDACIKCHESRGAATDCLACHR